MHQRLRLSRLWLSVVLVAFCLPLFNGLGRADLETDEAIYSYAVDRTLETGDWLVPKLSPSENDAFLEKPPLKFWIVAAPIRAGLLPHDEFGLRFWDAVAGGAAFLYVFAIGSILAGPVCGAVAVLLLFIHWPLVFAHGLRTNNMEAVLVLSYSGGVFHFLRWSALEERSARTRHAVAAGLLFALGFMVKFVAAFFLPLTLGLAALGFTRTRRLLLADVKIWLGVLVLVTALCAPWFIYMHVLFGAGFWSTIFGVHVFERMTSFLDPTHVHPWSYYLEAMWLEFGNQRMQWFMVAGGVVLLVQTVRRRWFEGTVVVLWAIVPMAIISAATSKLYHYAYPFLPPVMLAAGYLAALVMMLAPVPLRKGLEWLEDAAARRWPAFVQRASSPAARRAVSVIVIAAAAVAIVAVALGGLRLEIGGRMIFKSSGVLRPALLIVLAALATRTSARVSRLIVALFVFAAMPLDAYRGDLAQLPEGKHPIRSAAACVQRVDAESGRRLGMIVDIPEGIWHPLYYYFRRVQPWAPIPGSIETAIDSTLADPDSARPILMSDTIWRQYERTHHIGVAFGGAPAPPMLLFLDTVLLLPGPYSACSSEAPLRSSR